MSRLTQAVTLLGILAGYLYIRWSLDHVHLPQAKISPSWHNIRKDDAPLWCGKAYRPEDEVIDPGGRLSFRKVDYDILDVHCFTRMSTYFHGDEQAEVILRLGRTRTISRRAESDSDHVRLPDAPIELQLDVDGLTRTISFDKTRDVIFKISLLSMTPSHDESLLRCNIIAENQHINRQASLYYLPRRAYSGSMSRLDRVSGLTMVNSTTLGESTDWHSIYPYGYYGHPNDLRDLAQQGYNILHHIPDVSTAPNQGYPDNYAALLQEAADLGLWVMHDTRWTWQDPTLFRAQIEMNKRAPNLLTWYIADEPDGHTEDPKDLQTALKVLSQVDSRYHVTSSVLNCADFHFEEYSHNLDIIMTDPYPIGLVSSETGKSIYGTECTQTYGCCGCDNCFRNDSFDVRARINSISSNLHHLDSQSTIRLVPQGFGGSEHWSRIPTREEEEAIQIMGVLGTSGSVVWDYHASTDTSHLRAVTSEFANLIDTVMEFSIVVEEGESWTLGRGDNGTHNLILSVCAEDINLIGLESPSTRIIQLLGSGRYSTFPSLIIHCTKDISSLVLLVEK